MTTPPAVFGQFGRTLAFAERTLTATLREHLAQRDTKPETWYALQLIATDGPGLSRDALTRELLARLEADGLIQGGAQVDLTPEGANLHKSLREYIAGPTVRLLSQFDIHDIETTVRTLQEITRRAEAESSASAGGQPE